MIGRRGSQPGSPATFSSLNRMRSPESQTQIPVPVLPGSESYGYPIELGGRGENISGEQKAVLVLVNKVVSKLPCNSGTRLGMVEVDAGVQASVKALVQMARVKLQAVVHALANALEQLSKYPSNRETLDIIHSQVYLLHVLHQCLSASWHDHSNPRQPRSDPPPLDDNLARYLLGTILAYAHVSSEPVERTSSPAPRSREVSAGSSIARLTSSISSHTLNKSSSRHSFQDIPKTRDIVKSGPVSSECGDTVAASRRMQSYLRQIVGYITASNWTVVVGRIKNRISYLCTTIEDSPDVTDLRLIEWADLDRLRLSQLIQELSTSFLHVKRHAQVALASSLRIAIWSWIDHHTDQFITLTESNRRLEGGPDVLFDHLHSASDISSSSSARRTRVFYPLMAMLLVLCPDIFSRVAMGETGRSSSIGKKANFVESLKKGLTTSKGFEACASCYVDLISVTSKLGPDYDSTGVRTLVADSHSDLKNALFYSSNDISDPDVLVNGLVGLYRTSSGESSTFLKLLSDSSEQRKILAIQAAKQIAEEGARYPHYPPISHLRNDLAGAIRSLIRNQSQIVTAKNPELLEALELLIADPAYAHASSDADNLSVFIMTLGSMMVSPSPPGVRMLANQAVAKVFECLDEVPHLARLCGSAACSVLIDASRQELFDFHTLDWDAIALTTAALRTVSLAVLHFAESCPEAIVTCPQTLPAISLASQAMLTSLMGMDYRSASLGQPSLAAIQKLLLLAVSPIMTKLEREAPDSPKLEEIRSRLEFYDTVVNMPAAHGRQHYQRMLRAAVKPLIHPTAPALGIWYGLEAALKQVTAKIVDADDGFRRAEIAGLDEEETRFWKDVLPCLCSFASILVSTHEYGPSVAAMIGPDLLPSCYSSQEADRTRFEGFIRICIGLMASSNVGMRESIKDALGSDLLICCARVLFEQLQRAATPLLSTSSPNDYITIFTEQAVSIMRLTLDRHPTEGEPSANDTDIGELVLILARYIHRLGRGDAALRLKSRFCNVVELAMTRRGVTLGNHQRVGNSLLDNVLEWSSDVRETEQLEHSALKALVPLTEGLSLQTSDDTQSVIRSRQFLRAFQYLIHVIEQPGGHEDTSIRHPGSMSTHPSTVDSSSLAIAALANLLAANVDVGLKHCLSLGYHRDPVLRTAFMQVMSHTLQHGARFGSLGAKRQPIKNRPFLDTFTSNMALAIAAVEICPTGEVDELSMVLFRAFEVRGTLLSLLRTLIEREVSQTNHESELFRANSMTTRLLTHFAKTYGYNYVRATIQPLIFSLIDKPAETSFELDPSKAGNHEDIERNADHLRLMCQALLDLIYSSTPRIPVMLRVISHYIWEAVEDRFPESRHSAVGSFIFLRFFCPSIVAPDNIELEIPADSRDLRRGLLLITKVIQNLANNVTFGNKEPHMKVLNAFLRGNITQITKFLSDVAIRPRSHEIATAIKDSRDDAEKIQDGDSDELTIHLFVQRHISRLTTALDIMPPTFRAPNSLRSERTPLDGRTALSRIQSVMEQIGPPLETPKLDAYARSRMFEDYMTQNSGRSTDSVQSTFYEGPSGQTGRRIFYFIASKVGLADYDLLAFHIFQIVADAFEPFDIVFDLTGFASTNEIPMTWLKRMFQLCPPQILSAVNVIALYNTNTYAKRRIRRIVAELSPVCGIIGKHVVAACHPNELQASIPFMSLDLPDYTLELAYSAVKVYRPIFMVSDHEMQMQMGVKVGEDCVQLASWRQMEILPSVKSYIIDVLPYREIDDMTSDMDRLILKHGSETITFIARLDPRSGTSDVSRATLRQLETDLRSARARFRDTPSSQRALRPNDVPGTLLNIALINLHSSEESLRSAAYGLMQEIGTFFRYESMNKVIKVSAGLTVPRNSLSFSLSLSNTLAATAPHLTLEFVKEWISGFPRSDISHQSACLQYIVPWLPNLEAFAKPHRDDAAETNKQVTEIVRGLISLTVVEYTGAHLLIQERIWQNLAPYRGPLMDIILVELLQAAVDAGFGSNRGECIADILVSVASISVRGKVFTRLRKTLARTYLHTSNTLEENDAWPEICVLTRLSAMLAYHPSSFLDAQLFLPETLHSLTMLIGCGPVLMRQTVYGLLINTLHSLASAPPTGEMDGPALIELLARAQEPSMLAHFRLTQTGSHELAGSIKEGGEANSLDAVDALAKFLGEVLIAAAPSIDCSNSWRAKWMGLVASTCFQHNPATQPHAFTVLAAVATEEVDDDLVYQLLIAMSSILRQYTDRYTNMVTSMIRCLAKIIPALLPDSRYPFSMFWVGIGILQMGHLPLVGSGLDLIMSTLASLSHNGAPRAGFERGILEGRAGATDICRNLDQISGVSFETELHFSLVAIIWKGVRHPITRQKTIDCLMSLCQLASPDHKLAYFASLLPILSGSNDELRSLFVAAGMSVRNDELKNIGGIAVFNILNIRDTSTALLVITLVTTILTTTTSDLERVILYRLLADASDRIPDIVAATYDTIIPRAISVLGNTTNPSIIASVITIIDRAMADPSYTFPTDMGPSESSLSLNNHNIKHARSYSASISSIPSGAVGYHREGGGMNRGEMMLEEMGMRGLGDMSFNMGKNDRTQQIARIVADLINAYTS